MHFLPSLHLSLIHILYLYSILLRIGLILIMSAGLPYLRALRKPELVEIAEQVDFSK
jgi:hypothetical protein